MASSMRHVAIIDDDEAIRHSLSSVLSTYGIKPKAYGDALSGLEAIRKRPPDCILLDVRMPELDGLSMLRLISEFPEAPPVIIITGHADVAMAVQAMKGGAVDFIEKPIVDDLLVESIEQAIAASRAAAKGDGERLELRKRYEDLTEREKTVAKMVAEGYSTAAIAANLGISSRTVDHHRASLMAKMQATSLPQLMRFLLATTNS